MSRKWVNFRFATPQEAASFENDLAFLREHGLGRVGDCKINRRKGQPYFNVRVSMLRKEKPCRHRVGKYGKNRSRYPAICAAYDNGLTLKEVGKRFKITRERVRQILNMRWKPAQRRYHTSLMRLVNVAAKNIQRQIVQQFKKPVQKGISKHPLGNCWRNMLQRCGNKNHPLYKNYGARGITVCERWKSSFKAFVDDMGPRPEGKASDGRSYYSIDRIDNDGNYEPGNCRWATPKENCNNRRPSSRTILLEIDGSTKSLAGWARFYGIPVHTFLYRYHRGMRGQDLIRVRNAA